MVLNIKRFEDMLGLSSRDLSFPLHTSNFVTSEDLSWDCLFPHDVSAIERVLATESLAFVLTVAYGLKISNLSERKRVCVHIIGAIEASSNWNIGGLVSSNSALSSHLWGYELNEDLAILKSFDVSCFQRYHHESKGSQWDIRVCMNAGFITTTLDSHSEMYPSK